MTVGLVTAGFAISLICALVMGYAIQRGATCTVAAVSQLVEARKWGRIRGLMEAALWVAGGLLLARAFGFLPDLPAGRAITASTIIGGVLLGAGAYVNKACVFGTIARIGARDWAYLATPLGFLGGAWVVSRFGADAPASVMVAVSPLASLPTLTVFAFLLFAVWRIARIIVSKQGRLAERIWAPHEATVVIGIAFAIMFVAAGAWAYTDLLAELAMGTPGDVWVRLLLLAGLFGGSLIAGSVNDSGVRHRIRFGSVARTATGGAAMGAGSLLIPGSNDGLILVGMPLLYPFAWVAIGTMCLTIAVALGLDKLRAKRTTARHATS
ncbi:MAG: YeeE/YedE family protein [Sphingopyxis sp.]|nr:YeeE/YedE family protein [Sphingopyxis sp.]